MAEYRADDQFIVVTATGLHGQEVPIHIRHSADFMASVNFNVPHVKKSTLEIVDVSGAKDGAGSIVETKWNRELTKGEVETYRVKETPSELAAAFKKANLSIPPVKKSWGCIARNIGHALGMK